MCLCSSWSANSIGILFVHSWKNVPKSETNFWKQCIITEQWNTVMTPNFAHKIVHSSAMYYQNLIMIHECSKKLLKMKNIKTFFLTPSIWHHSKHFQISRPGCEKLSLAGTLPAPPPPSNTWGGRMRIPIFSGEEVSFGGSLWIFLRKPGKGGVFCNC